MTDDTATDDQISFAAAIGFKALAKLGITRIEIEYDGCGDSGCIESLTAFGARKKRFAIPASKMLTVTLIETSYNAETNRRIVTPVRKKLPVRNAIEQWAYDVLEKHFPGWELDGGSHGIITIDVGKQTACLDHDLRIEETISHSVEV